MPTDTEIVIIGRVRRPFGVHGDVHLESLSDVPERFDRLTAVTLLMPDGKTIETAVVRSRKMKQGYIMKFLGCSSPEEAKQYSGAFLQVEQEAVPPLSSTEYYQFELIGLDVHDESGRILGKIQEVISRPHQPLLVLNHEGEELLIPAVHPIVQSVDVNKGIMIVAPLEQWGITDAM